MSSIIYALDTHNLNKAMLLANSLYQKIDVIKLGLEFFIANGPFGVKEIAKCNIPIFLDLKLHDIPSTIAKTIDLIKSLGIQMLTLHINGGTNMLKKALSTVRDTEIKLIGVTVLTSTDNKDLNELGVKGEVKSHVILLAKLAKKIGLHGVVCSALEAKEVRKECGKDFIIITPGIRSIDSKVDDQKRIATPEEAVSLGSNYIVVGRLITSSNSPIESIESIRRSLS